jgi:hypothetical protein
LIFHLLKIMIDVDFIIRSNDFNIDYYNFHKIISNDNLNRSNYNNYISINIFLLIFRYIFFNKFISTSSNNSNKWTIFLFLFSFIYNILY